jgi:hypothetical protein
MLWASTICGVLALIGGFTAYNALRRNSAPEDPEGSRYMLALGGGMSVIFFLVILMMSVPVFFLNTCPS